jgi:protein gp37
VVDVGVIEMGKESQIEWTNHTWNPWQGCTKVSAGCKNCYMYRDKKRYGQDPTKVHLSSRQTFNKPLKWNKKTKNEPALVFVCSWSDFFHPAADAWRNEAWEIIRKSKNLTFQILTKRSDRIKDHLPKKGWPQEFLHVWLGVSVEDKNNLHRIDDLLEVDCLVKFVSAEPLLGNLTPDIDIYLDEIDWVIAGGESGPGFRHMDYTWAHGLRDHCEFFKVPFFFKQWGGWPDKQSGDKAKLDGRIHVGMPGIWENEMTKKFRSRLNALQGKPITGFSVSNTTSDKLNVSVRATDSLINFRINEKKGKDDIGRL